MARLDFTFITTATNAAGVSLGLDDIPQDVKDDVEEVYAYLKANPTGRMRTPAFASKTEMLTWVALVQAYCAVRPAGVLRFRKSPTRNLPENVMDFRITDPLPDNGAEGIAAAVEAVKAAAKPTLPTPAKATRK